MKQQAELTAKRWDYCAEGYSDIIQKEFVEVGDTWERLLRENTPAGAKRALDVGTGPGFFAMLLSMQGLETVGVDCSERMVAQASANAAARGLTVRFETMDSHELRFADNSFDYIVSRNATWLLYDPETAFSEWLRILRPGGRLLYLDANWCYKDDETLLRRMEEAYARFYRENGRSFNSYTGSAETDAAFRKVLAFEHTRRPEWDRETLPRLGYTDLRITQRMNELIYPPWKQTLYDAMDEFMVCASKPK